ncbi:MAG: glycosyltransferase family 4 protein [Candidatus Eisenbacteria bacterium]|uniref:Glycosyltransferase family 4 protein n=1 Tax=Eiseniibacteriota bacterium TaxID=2212470 RepID=A0A956NB35_UNCEI|nr:glycosyltransferase family 4 protein [Candidatus Eisenbacteria bacterium]MCB9462102.1 glycosyltransferase family 4 protein [Candidatus Eisenbacteria bacterium]
MRIVYFVQYFNLPHEPGGSRAYQFARAWVDRGHQVLIVTGMVNHKTLRVPEAYKGKLVHLEEVEGIRILRVWSFAGIRGSFRKRFLNFASYALSAGFFSLFRAGSVDLIYASSTPLTVGLPGRFLATIRRVPWVFEVRDLWPDSAIIAGVLSKTSWPTRLASHLANGFYANAARVVGVTRGIVDGLREHGVPEEKLLCVPNGVDNWMTEVDAPPPEPNEFQVVYVGAHGRWNGLGQILDAAHLLRDEGISFLFVGDGDERTALMERAERENLTRVEFCPAVPKKEAFDKIRRGSASIVVTWDHPFQKMVLANKIFDYLASGRPVIVGADGEMAELVREAGCGFVTRPEQPEELADAIRKMMALSPEERAEMGRKGREFILAEYQREHLAERLLATFETLTTRS